MEERTWIDAFTDGRDVSPMSAASDLAELPEDRIARVVGRYWAMDRDSAGNGPSGPSTRSRGACVPMHHLHNSLQKCVESYDAGVTDEFLEPILRRRHASGSAPDDAAILFNFRPDRGRQLASKLVEAGFDLTTMTRYSSELDVPVVFAEQVVREHARGDALRGPHRQLHVAETEKYAHVTYFFNGGVEERMAGRDPDPRPNQRDVPSYDHKPEMSAREVAARFAAEMGNGYRFAVINFANPDMVGHTGSIPAVTTAVEVADECLGVVADATHAAGSGCLVAPEEGNAERNARAGWCQPVHGPHDESGSLVLASLESVSASGGADTPI